MAEMLSTGENEPVLQQIILSRKCTKEITEGKKGS